MKKQAELGLNLSTRRTRKAVFLDEMELVVPWRELIALIAAASPVASTMRIPSSRNAASAACVSALMRSATASSAATLPSTTSTITVAQLLQPFPQFASIAINRNSGGSGPYKTDGGTSDYHSLQVSAIKRMSHGLNMQLAYTFSKQIEELRYTEPSDPAPARTIGQFDNPHRVSTAIIYELPFGTGSLKSGVGAVDKLIGGWQWSAMYIYQTGAAVALPAAIATGTSPDRSDATIDHWFNGASMTVMPAFTARRIPWYWPGLRVPAINNWDMSFIKNTWVYKERVKLQLRCEMINAFNRVWFGGLVTNPSAATYTMLTSQANPPRNIQFGLKLTF